MKTLIPILFLLLIIQFSTLAQKPFNVVIVSEGNSVRPNLLEQSMKAEITALLGSSYQVTFTDIFTNNDVTTAKEEIAAVYSQNTADVLIGTGITTSHILANQKGYLLPTIAGINLDHSVTAKSSNISNYTFIQSPFDIERDLKTLVEISKAKKITILITPVLQTLGLDINNYLPELEDVELELVPIDANPQTTLDAISTDADAVYIMSPLTQYTEAESKALMSGIIEKKLPSFSLLGNQMLNYGGYAAYSSRENLQKIQRRIALDVSKIAAGQDAKDFPIVIETYTHQLLINMETVNKIAVYPPWNLLAEATLININKIDTDRKISLQSVIVEGLENNIEYGIAKKETQIAGKEVSIAKSNYLPQLDVSSTGLLLDQNSVAGSFGAKGTFNWTAAASLSQLVLSEPALANIAIQKILLESQQKAEHQSRLDVILDVAVSYFNYRQVLAFTVLQNQNVNAKSENLNIAINKEKVGYSGASDVYRWQTELALAKVDYNATTAQLKSAQYRLNQILNRSIKEDFIVDDEEFTDNMATVFDERFMALIDNYSDYKKFEDFMVLEAMTNLPEIQQIELATQAQERLLKSNNRAFYIPTVAAVANYDYPIGVLGRGDPLPIPGIEVNSNPTWNAAIVVQIPILSGGARKHQAQKIQLGVYQLEDQQADIKNKLELQVRANMEQLNASYNNLKLSKSAAEAAQKNVTIVQNLYKEGQVNVTTLVDAQNSVLGAQINATNAVYQFMIDFFSLGRSTGKYMALATETQRSEMLQRFIQYKNAE